MLSLVYLAMRCLFQAIVACVDQCGGGRPGLGPKDCADDALANLRRTVKATLPTSPSASYHVAVSYYADFPGPNPLTCGQTQVVPATAILFSTGTDARVVSRTMETEAQLLPRPSTRWASVARCSRTPP